MVTIPIEMVPFRPGRRTLLVDIDSNEIKDLKGEAEIDVV